MEGQTIGQRVHSILFRLVLALSRLQASGVHSPAMYNVYRRVHQYSNLGTVVDRDFPRVFYIITSLGRYRSLTAKSVSLSVESKSSAAPALEGTD